MPTLGLREGLAWSRTKKQRQKKRVAHEVSTLPRVRQIPDTNWDLDGGKTRVKSEVEAQR